MPQSNVENAKALSCENSPIERFQRYARGRIAYFARRQILTIVGSGLVAALTTPLMGVIAALVALTGEIIDCYGLSRLLNGRQGAASFDHVSKIASITAGVQAISISVCILLAHILPPDGKGAAFSLIFLMSAALNAGLVWPYHRGSAIVRLLVYGATFITMISVQFSRINSGLTDYVTEALTMIMMAYIVFVILQFIITTHDRNLKYNLQILETSKALEASNRSKKQSQEQARKLSLVARYANDSVLISGPDGRITWVNEAFTSTTGYSLNEALGKLPPELLNDPATDPKVAALIAKHLEERRPIRAEILNRRKDGVRIWVETNIVPVLAEDGSVEMFVAIERDITAIKAHESQLALAKAQAERGEQAKTEFLATMSHEIRTPMNGIIGLSDLLAELDLSPDARAYAMTIKESADALLTIVNDILDVSKLDAGKLTIDPVEFDLNACFQSSVELLSPQATSKGIFLDVVEEHALPTLVQGDDGRFRQILLNVIGNAIKFTVQGGVTVKTEVSEERVNYLIKISVMDTGIGIPSDRIDQIFDKFQQADSRTSRQFGGTGLGLSISRQLAKLMGGEISVTSTENIGSEFVVTLKFDKPKSAQQASTQNELLNIKIAPMSVLVAEDNKTNRFLISKYLQDLPLRIHFAHDGREAVESAQKIKPDLIFMDMSMPEMDGLEATQLIRNSPDAQPHIIALTANAYARDRDACFAVGMDDFIAKPVKKAELLTKLKEVSLTIGTNPL